jgi:hypothetical protein
VCSSYALSNPGGWVSVTFTSFTTQAGYDLVQLFAGLSTRAPLLAVLSGKDPQPSTYSARDGA